MKSNYALKSTIHLANKFVGLIFVVRIFYVKEIRLNEPLIKKPMEQTYISPVTRWFVRVDQERSPTYLTLYTFVGAKFEAHRVLINQENICEWIEKIYTYPDIRAVFEHILFDPAYPQDVFCKILPRLCAIRDEHKA